MATLRDDVKLLGHWASVWATRVSIALNLKGIEYEFLEGIVLGSEGERIKSELLLSSNPVYKKIPVLIHDGKPICESLIILQYIDEQWATTGPSILLILMRVPSLVFGLLTSTSGFLNCSQC